MFLTLSAMAISACGGDEKKNECVLPTVRIDTVRHAGASVLMEFPGRVVSAQEANISFKVSGTIARLYVREGDFVKYGQLLAEMDPADYKVQLSATEAEYAQIKAEAERVISLYEEGAATANNYDKARYGLRQMEAKLRNHRDQVEYCRLYAPYDGYVKTVFFEGRETVAAGMPVVCVAGDGIPEILVNLPAPAYLQRETFASYEAEFNVLPGQILPLEFVSVMGEANTNQLYPLRLKLAAPNKDVAPGMSAWIIIKGEEIRSDNVRIPSTSIIEENGRSYVFAYDSQTQLVSRQEVKVEQLHSDGTAVVSANLKPNTLVVSSGTHFINDGDKVTPLARISETNVGGLL